ncbi:ER lumen protein-retaining receptor-like protein [Emericellopsis cladophorae]|uniref:ER lumen protein-retaining receptor-like protein n=1 Tax=Emericellopsis cladophorae TaxID=2686198 RepID=A0A9P9Y896_9HYPO|nr:ER lumen protein-retaining receptor-like protein [Emericellopsis cladophorae]KAI6784619.1 ER lumen protein-retaining receptor-like protein [Emericellopsis cladophorae]
MWNIFRYLGDISHILSKLILILSIHRNRSAEGVSLITQLLYGLVFCTRYLDLFDSSKPHPAWNVIFKTFYIISSFYILGVMQWMFPRTREREVAWKLGAVVLGGSLVLSPFAMLIIEQKEFWGFVHWLWVFSEILESVCVLPQLLLLRQTTVPTVIDSFYLLTLGSYRALYCFNWLVRKLDSTDPGPDTVSVIFGIIQTALYIDFAWVYYTRQRVKLRGGGVVDADDLRNSWLLRRIFGRFAPRHSNMDDEDEESGPALGGGRNGSRPAWGSRGISVSADDGVFDADRDGQEEGVTSGPVDPDARMKDPDELARAMEDDDEEDNGASGSSKPYRDEAGVEASGAGGIRNDEWRD